jgi:Fur family ferric uptake transcriptional regulator
LSKYITKQRTVLTDYLSAHADEQLSPKQIADALKEYEISLSAVYRNLSALEADGKVRRCTKYGLRETFFQYTDTDKCRDHIHLSCKKCGKTCHITSDASVLINSIEQTENFTIDKTDTVLYGICKDCKEK